MKCAICNGTIAIKTKSFKLHRRVVFLVRDEICEFCKADIQYTELSYSEVS